MPAVLEPASLRSIPLFAGLNEEQLAEISRRVRRHQFPAGAYVITADSPGDAVFLILNGTVQIKVDQPDGKEVIIAILGPGSVVGEMSVLDSSGRSADVHTLEETAMLRIDRATFNELVDTVPVIARNLLRILTTRLRLSTEQIQALCTLDVYGRVARQILAFADLYGLPVPEGICIPLRLTQSDIAGLVGASRERVNQVFVALRDRGLITVDNTYRITILDQPRLRALLSQR